MQVVRLADIVGVNSMIENQQFSDALVVGPAVLAPLESVGIQDCTFDGGLDSLFIEVPDGRTVVGVIGLRHVQFVKCEFRNVSIIGTAQSIAEFKRGFSQSPRIVPQG